MKKWIKWIIILLVLAALVWAAYLYFKPKEKVSYVTETVKRGKIQQTVLATGEITSSHLVDVGAQVSGQIKKMYVKIGDQVKQGDLIAQIDNVSQTNELNTNRARLDTYRAQLASAKIVLKTAQRSFDRYSALLKEGAVSKEEYEQNLQ